MKSYLLYLFIFLSFASHSPSIFSEAESTFDFIAEEQNDKKSSTPASDKSEKPNTPASPIHPLDHDFEHHGFPFSLGDQPSGDDKSFEAKFFNMLFILALLIAFMFIASWALKRMMKSKVSNMNSGSSIKVLESRYLSPRATLYLIEVNGQNLLIAESPTTVTHLKVFHTKSD